LMKLLRVSRWLILASHQRMTHFIINKYIRIYEKYKIF